MTDNTQELDEIIQRHFRHLAAKAYAEVDGYRPEVENAPALWDKIVSRAESDLLNWHNRQVKNAVVTAEDNLDQYWNKELDKQIEEVLDRLESNKETLYWWTGGEYEKTTAVDMRAIAAERAKLKEVK